MYIPRQSRVGRGEGRCVSRVARERRGGEDFVAMRGGRRGERGRVS